MSSHESHDHPNTPAARAKCRRANSTERVIRPDVSGVTRELVRDLYAANRAAQLNAIVDANATAQLNAVIEENARLAKINWADDHCMSCGETDLEYVAMRSYSGCCNKRVCTGMYRDETPCCPANALATNREYGN